MHQDSKWHALGLWSSGLTSHLHVHSQASFVKVPGSIPGSSTLFELFAESNCFLLPLSQWCCQSAVKARLLEAQRNRSTIQFPGDRYHLTGRVPAFGAWEVVKAGPTRDDSGGAFFFPSGPPICVTQVFPPRSATKVRFSFPELKYPSILHCSICSSLESCLSISTAAVVVQIPSAATTPQSLQDADVGDPDLGFELNSI